MLIERIRQDSKWGVQHWPDGTATHVTDARSAREAKLKTDLHMQAGIVTWRDILHEEVREAFAEKEWAEIRQELIQSAAVICAWIEDGDSRDGRTSDTGKMDQPKFNFGVQDLPRIVPGSGPGARLDSGQG